jgi:hypothetical protein
MVLMLVGATYDRRQTTPDNNSCSSTLRSGHGGPYDRFYPYLGQTSKICVENQERRVLAVEFLAVARTMAVTKGHIGRGFDGSGNLDGSGNS